MPNALTTPRTAFRDSVFLGSAGSVTVDYYYVTQDDEIDHLIDWLQRYKAFSPDVETGGLDVWTDPLATLQIGNPLCAEPRAYVIDVRCVSADALKRLAPFFTGREYFKLGMNIGFECRWLQHKLGWPLRRVGCIQATELVARAGLFPGGKGGDSEYDKKPYQFSSMARLCERYLGIHIDKNPAIRLTFASTPPGAHTREHIVYAAGDTIYPFYVFQRQQNVVTSRNLTEILKIEFEVIPALIDTELYGIGIDKPYWTRLWQKAVAEQENAERTLDKLFLREQGDLFDNGVMHVRPLYYGGKGKNAKPQPLNWGSATQVRWAIQQYCQAIQWPVKLLTTIKEIRDAKVATQKGRDWMAKRGYTVADLCASQADVEAGKPMIPDYVLSERQYCILLDAEQDTLMLRKIRKQLPAEFVDAYLAWAQQKSLVSTFGVKFLNNLKGDGRIHVEWHALIAATGRMSSTPNLQNIPSDQVYRQAFKPRAGYAFVIADYSQIEPRISACVSNDAVYLSNYAAKGDLYVTIAEQMLGRKVDKHTPQGKEDRKAVKAVVLGMAYRMGPGKLRDSLTLTLERDVSFDEAANLHRLFLETCEGIKNFQVLCEQQATPGTQYTQTIYDDFLNAEVTYVVSACGRIRFFPPNAKGLFTEPTNHPIQGLSATITKVAVVNIQRRIDDEGWDAHGVNYVHDEIVYECRLDQADAFALVVKAEMEKAGQHYITNVPVIAEFPENSNGVVPFWAKEIKEAA